MSVICEEDRDNSLKTLSENVRPIHSLRYKDKNKQETTVTRAKMKTIISFFLDLSKTFDTIKQEILMTELGNKVSFKELT